MTSNNQENKKIVNDSDPKNNNLIFFDYIDNPEIGKTRTKLYDHPKISTVVSNEDTEPIYVLSFLTFLDILFLGIRMRYRPGGINDYDIFVLNTIFLLGCNFLFCQAFTSKNIYEMGMYLVFFLVFFINLFIDSKKVINVYGLFKLLSAIVRLIETIYIFRWANY